MCRVTTHQPMPRAGTPQPTSTTSQVPDIARTDVVAARETAAWLRSVEVARRESMLSILFEVWCKKLEVLRT